MKSYFLKILLLVFFLCSTSCFKKNKSSEQSFLLSETFRFNIATEPPTLDWNKATDTVSSLVVDNIMDGLLDYDFSKKKIALQPALAESWSSSPDRKIWTFTIRQGVKWSDGQELKAQHVLDSWERLLNPHTASEYAYPLYVIKNAKAYNKGELKDFSKVGVSVNNKKSQLIVELKQAMSEFPYLVSHSSTYPVRKDVIQKYGNRWTEPKNLVTLGAYELKKWEHDKQILLQRNDNYYKLPLSKIKNVILYMISEPVTAFNLFEQGRLDAVIPPATQLPILRKRKNYKEHGILGIYYYGFHVNKKPFRNVLVRKAFSQAINKKQITDLLQGGQIPLYGWIPTGVFGYDSSVGLPFDPEKANHLMDEAGYEDRSLFPKVKLSYNTDENHKRIAENIQSQLKKNLKIRIELSNEEWKTYLQSLKVGRQEIYRMGWLADYPSPDNFMTLMTSDSENNRTFWGNTQYDQLTRQARSLLDNKKRAQLYKKAQKLLVEEGIPVIPIYSSRSHWLISDRVTNFPLNVMNRIYFREIILR